MTIPQAKHLQVRNMPAKGPQHTSEMLWEDCSPAMQFSFGASSTFNLSGKTKGKSNKTAYFQYSAYRKLVKVSRSGD